MGRLFWVAAALLAATSMSRAADMPMKAPPLAASPAYVWTGCYLGANLGFGWAHKRIIDEDFGAQGNPRNDHVNSGVVGGGQLGCDYQLSGNWVIGIQGLIDASDVKGNSSDPTNASFTWQSKNSWFATLTGRIGYAIQPMTLLYVKGGAARVRDSNLLLNTGSIQSTPDRTMSGWIAGGGLEYKFAMNWSAFVEYDYIGLNTINRELFTRNTDGFVFPYDVHNTLQIVLVGLNYRFGGR